MTTSRDNPQSYVERVRSIEQALVECISGNLDARMPVSNDADELDAVATGINILVDEVATILTERDKRAELAESERRLANAQQIAHLGSWEWLVQSNELTWSDETYRIFGLEPQSIPITYEEYVSRVHADDQQTLQDSLKTTIEQTKPFHTVQRIVRDNGEVRTLEVQAVLVDDSGSNAGTMLSGTYLDVTDRVAMEKNLRDRDEKTLRLQIALDRLDRQIDFTPDQLAAAWHLLTETAVEALGIERCSVWMYSEDRDLIRCIDLYTQSNQTHSDGLELHANVYPSYFDALQEERIIAAHDAANDPQTCEFRDNYLKPMGIVSMLDAPIRLGGKMAGVICNEHTGEQRRWSAEEQAFASTLGGYASQLMETTQRLDLERQLQQADRMRSLGTLAGGVAHDFNNQLAGIRTAADLLKRLADTDCDKQQRCIDTILTASQHAAALTDQLLAFARGGRYVEEPVNLHSLIEEIANLLSHAMDRRIEIQTSLGAALPTTQGDASQLQNMLLNIAINARDAMGDGGTLSIRSWNIESCPETTVGFSIAPPAGACIEIQIQDTGCGMNAETLKHIFEPFYTTKSTSIGTGMGMATVFGVVKKHGGGLKVESSLKEGTTVTVLLPSVLLTAQQDAKTLPDYQDRPRGRQTHILLVEDEPAVQEMTRLLLEQEGHDVTCFGNGQEAVQHIQANPTRYDGVVLDVIMPGMKGSDVLQWIRDINPTLPVLICSGFTPDGTMVDLLQMNDVRFLQKPYDSWTFLSEVHAFVGSDPSSAER